MERSLGTSKGFRGLGFRGMHPNYLEAVLRFTIGQKSSWIRRALGWFQTRNPTPVQLQTDGRLWASNRAVAGGRPFNDFHLTLRSFGVEGLGSGGLGLGCLRFTVSGLGGLGLGV